MPLHHKEAAMNTMDVGKKLVALCREGKFNECMQQLYAKDIVSVEAGAPPNMEREARGIEAVIAKGKWWEDNHEVHSATTEGPFPHDDRFAVHFVFDVTNKPSAKRIKMDEIALYTVKDGKIVREEFFYTMG
jgi:ketosteroid isomerase-like protein